MNKFILNSILIAAFAFLGSCNKEETVHLETSENTASRTEMEEIDFVESEALSISKNKEGYWEADFGNGIVMIYVPQGSFTIGNNKLKDASPEHKVHLDHYWISKTPITNGQFRAFVESTGYVTEVEKEGHPGPFVLKMPKATHFEPTPGYHWDNAYKDILAKFPEITITDDHPVSCISWNDAIAYTDWLKTKYNLEFTLPTEAEWEYAARGNDGRIYPWGNEIPDGTRANYADETMNKYFPKLEQAVVHFGVDDGYALTSPVGSFPLGASPIGALDMAGNLTEWIYDSFYDYTEETQTNPVGNHEAEIKMQKAGFWCGSAGRFDVKPDEIKDGHNIRADARQGDDKDSADDHLGFRIAISYTVRK